MAESTTAVGRLVQVVALLREHCLWTAALTHESLVEYLIEESHELAEVIEAGPGTATGELKGELADVLFQVLLHARIQEEAGNFDFEDVAEYLSAKLVRRNRHVFKPDGSLQESFPESIEEIVASYDAVKQDERPERDSPFDGIPPTLPALTLAAKSIDRARRAGFPMDQQLGSSEAGSQSPTSHDEPLAPQSQAPTSETELGNLLLAVVSQASAAGLDAEQALRGAVRRFQRGVTGA
ncbi:MazG nucleotide pyrophosphohydrolase domain-containing protein [Crystallibacter degradans]|uniref:MazG nucleotide pyrophosphohydrolase domain-containing protein n=1 Tax=Crystallibacter degradans TaxID=2726743 RepID=UPI001473C3EA|nr:MazG nucleotide pyrophosphohydrolase domain-containing protein [Arthrobacter sp. SF27]NMR28327.1 nucleotide pyrophosphohydrolase [Arthrobacter sp. SF27]